MGLHNLSVYKQYNISIYLIITKALKLSKLHEALDFTFIHSFQKKIEREQTIINVHLQQSCLIG